MIDIAKELEKFPVINLQKLEESNDIPDNIRNSIILYNSALENLNSKSEDIAVIELKKAIAVNPTFYEAMNLLGLCYVYINEISKAADMFRRVIDAESNSIQALDYMNIIKSLADGELIVKKSKKTARNGSGKKILNWVMRGLDIENGNPDVLKYIIGFVLGAVIIFVVTIFIKLPEEGFTIFKGTDEELIASYESQIKDLNNKIDLKVSENDDLKNKLETLTAQIEDFNNTEELLEVENLISKEEYEKAADKLLLLQAIEFKGASKEKFENLFKDVIPKAALKIYNEATNYKNKNDFESAIERYNKVLTYGEDWQYMDQLMYNLGKCYISVKQYDKAIVNFNKIIEKYPNSNYAYWSNIRISEIKSIQATN